MNEQEEKTGVQQTATGNHNDHAAMAEPVILRSDEAAEMLERTPAWMLRRGVMVIIGLFAIIALIAVFIKYPDTLEGRASVTTTPLPIRLKTANSGRIARLFVADNATIDPNTPVAEIENHTGYENIQLLQQYTDSAEHYLNSSDLNALSHMLDSPLYTLGEAQNFYNQLLQNTSAYLLLKKEQLYNHRIGNLQQQISRYHTAINIGNQQAELDREELKQYNERFRANEQLYQDKVISRNEYFEEAARLRQKKISLEERNKNAVQGSITINDYRKQLLDMQYDREEKDRQLHVAIMEAVRNIRNYIQTWKMQYLLSAPFKGKVHYLRMLQQNEMVNAGDELFAIVPENAHYGAHISVASAGIGKIKKGQAVHILLDKYPYNEYGFLEGQVTDISALPEAATTSGQQQNQLTYLVHVSLPDSLVTTYHIQLPAAPEMSGTARIITKDKNLLQRLIMGAARMNK